MSRPKEIVCDYLVLETGYTSRLIKTFSDPAKRVIDSVDKVSVVCIKDELWGQRQRQVGHVDRGAGAKGHAL